MSDIDPKDDAVVLEKAPISLDDTTDTLPLEQDSCTPLPDDVTKRSKKRLREVSLEASTPKDDDVLPADSKEVEVPPKKKDRVQSLQPAVQEETQPQPSTTPPPAATADLSTSPPHDSKVRQIRRRVKDLSWKEAQRKRPDEASTGEVDQQDEGPEAGDALSEGKADDDDSSKSVSAKSDSDKEEVERAGGEKPATTEIVTDPPPTAPQEGKPTVEASIPTDDEHTSPETTIVGTSTPVASPATEACQGKRRRDDGDQNPRDTKRISPPPDQEKTGASAQSVKPTGFMAYASSASPFAVSKNAPNIFGSSGTTPTFGSTSIPKPPASSSFPSATTSSYNNQTPFTSKTPPSVTFGSSGFNAYASTASPFATASASGVSPFGVASSSKSKSPSRVERSKSPGRHANAFGPYTTRSGKFAAAPSRPSKKQKRGSIANGLDLSEAGTGSGSGSGSGDEAGDEEPGSPTNFGDILSAKENQPEFVEEKKVEYTEQEVMTGEEDEKTEYQVRAKLFAMAPPPVSGWKERGVGLLKLNVNRKTGRARLVLRTDGVLRLVLNTNLFKGMNFEIAQDPRYVKFGLIQDKKVVLHTLRLASVRHAEDLLERVKAHTPGVSATSNAGEV